MLKLIRHFILGVPLVLSPIVCVSEEIKTLSIYTTRSLAKTIQQYIQKDFEAKHNCKLKFLNSQGIESIITEISLAKAPRGDVVVGISHDSCKQAKFRSHFKELNVGSYVHRLYLPVRWEDKQFVPVQLAFLSFIYDKNIVVEPIQSFDDLLNAKHKVILSDPRTSVPGQSLMYWVKNVYKNQTDVFWKKFKPRILTITKSWSDAYSLFLKGEAPIVISYTTSALYHKLQENKHNIVASQFKEGQYMEVLIGGALKTTANPELAEEFLLALLAETFQRAVVFDSWCFPVVKLNDLPPELRVHPKFINVTSSEDWGIFKKQALDELLESLSS